MKTPDTRSARGFTLIEIMVVVGILGIVMAMGVPSIWRALRREGMRKAVADIVQVCGNARADAILKGDTTELVFSAENNRFSIQGAGGGGGDQEGGAPVLGAQLPDGIAIADLKVNGVDFMEQSEARVHFYPNGTCDDFTIALLSEQSEVRRITLEITTGLAEVEILR